MWCSPLVLALLLAPTGVFADDFSDQVNEAVRKAKPQPRAAPTIGANYWREPSSYRWIDRDTFVGPFGLRMDKSCLANEGVKYPARPEKFIQSVRAMHDGLQECASERVVPATVGLIYERMPRATIFCDPSACKYDDKSVDAIACTDSDELKVSIRKPASYLNVSTLFHELAHATKHVDNQVWADHAHHDRHPLRDEVYFWERHCFQQPDLIVRMRNALIEREAELKLTESTEDLKRFYTEAYEICARPFRFNVRRSLRANEREIEAVCTQYAQYLSMERGMQRQLRRLTAEAGAERPKLSPQTEAALTKLHLELPPKPPFSAQAFGTWSSENCFYYSKQENVTNPAGILRLCANRMSTRANSVETTEELFAAEAPWEEISAVEQYYHRLALKSNALAEGPGRYEDAMQEQGEKKLAFYYEASRKECARAEIKDSAFCKELALDEAPMRLLGALFLHWKPKTLR